MSLTKIGAQRQWYSQNIEHGPSRFSNEGRDYQEWAARADQYFTRPIIVKRDGIEIDRAHDELSWVHKNTSYSHDHATKFEGYKFERIH